MSDAREESLVLPNGPGSIGVLTRPGGQLASPTFVFLNAGWLRKVGPNRLYVRLARTMARRGHGALRFDFPGVGDSPPRTDGLPLHRSMLVETRLAMDTLEERFGEDSFVLVGLCSGADAAYRVAVEDSRVTGVVFLDGFPFRTAAWYWHHYRRLTRLESWRSFLRRLFSGGGVSPMAEGGRDLPTRNEASEGLAELVDRGTRLLFVYTGGLANYYNHAGQFASLFPAIAAHERARVAYLPEVDHVFSSREGQETLSRIVESWLSSSRIRAHSVKVMTSEPRPRPLQRSVQRAPRLLVLSYNFPPDQEVGGLRWAGLTKYLARMGWECEVITQPWAGPVEVPEGVAVKRVAPLTTLRSLYRRMRGVPRRRSGTLLASASTPDPDSGSHRRSTLRKMAVAVLTYPDVGRGWILRAALTLRARIREFHPDLVVSTGPPHSVHLSALLATRGLDIAWWCDFRDPWSPLSESEGLLRRSLGWMEYTVLTRASGCITTTPQLARILEARYPGLAAHCVLNAVDAEQLTKQRARDRAFSVVHVGTLYGGRDPGVVLEGFSRFLKEHPEVESSNPRLDLIGPVEAHYASLEGARLADLKIDDRVNLPGPLPRPRAVKILAGASVAIVLAQEQETQIPAKLYECLALGVPTLVVTESGSATSEVARELGAFEVDVDDPEGVAAFLARVWEEGRSGGRTSARPVEYEGRAREFAGLFGKVEDVDVHA